MCSPTSSHGDILASSRSTLLKSQTNNLKFQFLSPRGIIKRQKKKKRNKYHGMTIADSRYKLLKEEPCLNQKPESRNHRKKKCNHYTAKERKHKKKGPKIIV
jgi:hypothetical protein